jgi:L-cysteine desulfidase
MSGGSFEIMASCGSGNQGIIASIPVAVLGEQLGSDKSDIGRALVLSHLMTAKMTTETSIIGAMCGCVIKAGLGAAAGCAWLLSKDCEVVSGAINNMAGNLVGEICDGAKVGCALKLSSAAGVAIESAYLASKGVMIPWTNGIVGKTAGETLQNIGLLASTMRETDRRIVEIMKGKG